MLFEFNQFKKTKEATTDYDTITELTQDKEKIKRVLLRSNILTESLAKQYADTKSNTARNIIKRLCSSELAHRYKVRTRLGRSTGLIGRIRFFNKKYVSKRSRTANTIQKFFIQDDVSRPSAGKKETRTFKNQKKQKRYLLDTMKNLHKKFKRVTGSTICYTTFIKYKPFYVVKPRLADRDTCVCKVHANMNLKFIAL
ncbi:hypothetical protein PYW08_009156 [Mythimna loreyi]|uniref:Uncharacterized protein n=1 Tax=Mythimna loreyi TaxID=667449 RepID=A0ACC2QAG5_9NEOP|nr:hypothetical protein PYW08_009156 [Mythimna loreyi]